MSNGIMRSLKRGACLVAIGAVLGATSPAAHAQTAAEVRKVETDVSTSFKNAKDLLGTIKDELSRQKSAPGANVEDLTTWINRVDKMKNALGFLGFGLAVFDFALSFAPVENKQMKQLQTIDRGLTQLRGDLGNARTEIPLEALLRTKINNFTTEMGKYDRELEASATYYVWTAEGKQRNASGVPVSSAEQSVVRAMDIVTNTPITNLTMSTSIINNNCLADAQLGTNIFQAVVDNIGDANLVTSMGATFISWISQMQRYETLAYMLSPTTTAAYPNEAERTLHAINETKKAYEPIISACTDAFRNALKSLDDDATIKKLAEKQLERKAALLQSAPKTFPQELGQSLARNMPHRDWLVMAYDDVSGFDNHSMTGYSNFILTTDAASRKRIVIAWDRKDPLVSLRAETSLWQRCVRSFKVNNLIIPFFQEDVSKGVFLHCGLHNPFFNFYSAATGFVWAGNPNGIRNPDAWTSAPDRIFFDVAAKLPAPPPADLVDTTTGVPYKPTPSNRCRLRINQPDLNVGCATYPIPYMAVIPRSPPRTAAGIGLGFADGSEDNLVVRTGNGRMLILPAHPQTDWQWTFQRLDNGYYRISTTVGPNPAERALKAEPYGTVRLTSVGAEDSSAQWALVRAGDGGVGDGIARFKICNRTADGTDSVCLARGTESLAPILLSTDNFRHDPASVDKWRIEVKPYGADRIPIGP